MRTQRAKDSFLLIGRISGFDFDIRDEVWFDVEKPPTARGRLSEEEQTPSPSRVLNISYFLQD